MITTKIQGKCLGFLGPENTNTHKAAILYAKGCYELKPYASLSILLQAFLKGEVSAVVVPTENTVGGEVAGIVPWFFSHVLEDNLYIIGEVIIPIEHKLLMLFGASINDIKQVLSKDQALLQCSRFLKEYNIEPVACDSTGFAALEILDRCDKSIAAIAPANCATSSHVIFDGHIMDVERNETRFIVLGREEIDQLGEKTTFIFTTKNEPGALYHALGGLYYHELNMTRIDSWTSGFKLGEYSFWIDVSNGHSHSRINLVLETLKRFTDSVKILGTYPVITGN